MALEPSSYYRARVQANENEINRLQGLLSNPDISSDDRAEISARIRVIEADNVQLRSLSRQALLSEQAVGQTGSTTSSGQQVVDDGDTFGTSSTLNALGVAVPLGVFSGSGTNAVRTDTSAYFQPNVNSFPLRSLENTQATSGPAGFGSPRLAAGGVDFATSPGVGSDNDNAAPTTTQRAEATRAAIGQTFAEPIKPQPNVLDKYFSYTYVAELRLIKPEAFAASMRNRRINYDNAGLLIRSGGANGVASTNNNQRRNQYFDLDFYLDNIKLTSHCQGTGTGSAHNYQDISFTVTEPNGISFLDRLYLATKDYVGIENYSSAIYLMIIKFYAYDTGGKIVAANNQNSGAYNDPNAVVVKTIPFTINDIAFTIDSNLVTYSVTGSCIAYEGSMTNRGTIARNIEISGDTVDKLLRGVTITNIDAEVAADQGTFQGQSFPLGGNFGSDAVATPSVNAPNNASASQTTNKYQIVSLQDALNYEEKKHIAQGLFEIANQYVIEIASPVIANSMVGTDKGFPDLSNSPMTDSSDPKNTSDDAQTADRKKRVVGIAAGTPIIQAIEMIIRQSTFITDQADITYDQTTDQPLPIPSTKDRPFAWFKVNMKSEQLQYDKKRNDYAYKITYIISLYNITGMDSPYFPTGQFRGVHKSYPYWFTGQNTAVLDYKATFNYAWTSLISGSADQQAQGGAFSLSQIRKKVFAPRSAESSQGFKNRGGEVAASAAAYLYDQGALGEVNLRIIGDPAWLAQGELWPGVDANNFDYKPFLPDGTINFDASQPMFEIKYAKPVDYNISTGLMNPDPKRLGPDNENLISYVYRANTVESIFSDGTFTQQLQGTLYYLPTPETVKGNALTFDDPVQTINSTLLRTPRPDNNSPLLPNLSSATSNLPAGFNLNLPLNEVNVASPPFNAAPLPWNAPSLPTSSGRLSPVPLTSTGPQTIPQDQFRFGLGSGIDRLTTLRVTNSRTQLIKKEP